MPTPEILPLPPVASISVKMNGWTARTSGSTPAATFITSRYSANVPSELITITCALTPSTLSRNCCWNPVVTASTVVSAAPPKTTPRAASSALFFRPVYRWRQAIRSSKSTPRRHEPRAGVALQPAVLRLEDGRDDAADARGFCQVRVEPGRLGPRGILVPGEGGQGDRGYADAFARPALARLAEARMAVLAGHP